MKNVLFDTTRGDTSTIDGVPIGQTTPAAVAATTLSATGATVLTGAVSGAGFVAAVQAVIEGDIPALRYLPITDAKTDAGVAPTASASSTSPGVSRTAGTSLALVGVATSGVTPATTKMLWEFDLPSTYVAAAPIPVAIDCVVATATDVTAASTTLTVNAYTVSPGGVEAAISGITAAQDIPLTTAAVLTYSIPGTGLAPGQRVCLELVALVTTTIGGASSVTVNSVGYAA